MQRRLVFFKDYFLFCPTWCKYNYYIFVGHKHIKRTVTKKTNIRFFCQIVEGFRRFPRFSGESSSPTVSLALCNRFLINNTISNANRTILIISTILCRADHIPSTTGGIQLANHSLPLMIKMEIQSILFPFIHFLWDVAL